MKLLRKTVFWLHLATGIAAAGVVIIMSATGVLLTYQKQLTAWADRRAAVVVPGTNRMAAESLLARTRAATGAEPTAITLRRDPRSATEIAFGRERREYVDPYRAELLGGGSTGIREFFRIVTAWHRTLGARGDNRNVGRMMTGAANLGFLFLVVSGFYLWWPRSWSWKALRNVLWFRRRLRGKASDFNWHNVVGFWSLAPLFIIVLSGVVISYRWAGNLVYRSVGEKPPVAAAPPATTAPARPPRPRVIDGVDRAVAAAAAKVPKWRTLAITLPTGADSTVSVAIDAGTGGQPQLRSTLVVNRLSGEEVRWDQFSGQSAGRRLRSWLRFAHTGEVFGIAGQTVAGLVTFGSLILAWTGIALTVRRLRGWTRRRRAPSIVQECPPPRSGRSRALATPSSPATDP